MSDGVLDLFEATWAAAHRKQPIPTDFRDVQKKQARWSEDLRCWLLWRARIDPVAMALLDWGAPPSKNVPTFAPEAEVASWLGKAQAEGSAISIDQAQVLAMEFIRKVVPDWQLANYQLKSLATDYGRRNVYGEPPTVDAVWFSLRFVQAPYAERGEIAVNEVPIVISIDPFSGEISGFIRNPGRRLEPRIAMLGPATVTEERAHSMWHDEVRTNFFEGDPPGMRLVSDAEFKLMVDVTWDPSDKATGRLAWDIRYPHQSKERNRPPDPRDMKGIGRMRIDAYTGQIYYHQLFN